MNREIDLDFDGLMRQASMTADDYLAKACDILSKTCEKWTTGDAIELSKVMAQDFHSSVMGLKMQEIRDSIYTVAASLDNLEER